MQTFLLGLQAVAYALVGVAAILGLIFVLMKVIGHIMTRKHPTQNESPPISPDDQDKPESMS